MIGKFIFAGLAVVVVSILPGVAIETPDYESLGKDGKFELRKYAAIPVASTPMDGMGTRNDSFRRLFNYISGENGEARKIAMTAPVFMEDSAKDAADGNEGRMSFVIPKKVEEDGIPEPRRESLTIGEIRAGTVAVLRFTGWRSEASREAAVEQLRQWVADQGLKTLGDPFFAFYNPPWTPEAFRRNEVWLRVLPH